ncbi:GSCFA domain-containing protein [Hymenobacter jejuensis]|uniref:GSCFA domain-containing protein n=1 Tax=Hymenobacter jejuensis TaxID=2502781 RepID=A0A5B8A1B3_9BACT|nr:GSCFA domain-containing protein [Hymenobacter jejuensis]QDA61110.1 GSCFA domain-containing protein [Hymenobacter jejuensis]
MFRTELSLTPHPNQLPLSARVITVGSCFSDVIGNRLAAAKVHTLVNPFGTVFNPLSACKLIRAAAGEEMDWQQHLVEARGRWQSYDLHATVGADSPVALLQHIQQVVQQAGDFIQSSDLLILTLGTAYAYRLRETQEIVSNCHKVPADRFDKELLTADEIVAAVAETHAYLRLRNPKLRILLTVSPVRHLKDTLPLNAVSKSVLRVACHYLSELLPDVSYFPAYELLLDDLRDYRFYADDMLHPSSVAEDYIWERFTRTYFDGAFGRFKKEWESIQQALAHRPLYPAAPEHRQFLESTLARLQKLAAQVDLRAEIREVQKQIAALPLPAKPLPEPEPEFDDEERIDVGQVDDTSNVLPAVSEATPVATLSEVEPEEEEEEYEVHEPHSFISTPEPLPAPFAKKKRRSRGGAKRTARKRAAQEAALLLEQSVDSSSGVITQNEEPETLDIQTDTNQLPHIELEHDQLPAAVSDADAPALTLEITSPVEASDDELITSVPVPARPTRSRGGRTATTGRSAVRKSATKAPKPAAAKKPARTGRSKTGAAEAALSALLAGLAPEAPAPVAPSPLLVAPPELPASTPPVPEEALPKAASPKPAPKRRSRPPRKKPAADENPEKS